MPIVNYIEYNFSFISKAVRGMTIKPYSNVKVTVGSIHGKFPFKKYLQVIGTNLYGEYIVIVSNHQICGESEKELKIRFKTTKSVGVQSLISGTEYTCRIVNPLELKRNNIEMRVFIPDNMESRGI